MFKLMGKKIIKFYANKISLSGLMSYIMIYLPNKNVEYMVIPILMHCEPYKAACQLKKCNVINDINLFPTVYHIIGYSVPNCRRYPISTALQKQVD